MPIGVASAAALAMIYHGLKESFLYSYKTPVLKNGFKGGSQWKELRFRHPAPANEPSNGQLSARETPFDHWKVPYPYSKHNVRHYYPPEVDDQPMMVGRTLIDLERLSPLESARFLDYVPGDEAGNALKKEKYLAYFERTKAFGISAQMAASADEVAANPLSVINEIKEFKAEMGRLNYLGDEGTPEYESEYICGPDTYLAPYDLHCKS